MKDEAESAIAELPTSSTTSSATHRSEFEFINNLRARARGRHQSTEGAVPSSFILHPSTLPRHPSSLLNGVGDDAAVIRETAGRNSLVTADLLVEDIDFHRDTTTALLLGHKALAVSLSDIAAMGGRPQWALLSLGIPNDIWNSHFLDEFYEGFFTLADRYGVALVGGDVSRTPEKIVVDSIVMGQCNDRQAILRSGARPGDYLFVTGSLGGSAAGLRLLERGARVLPKDVLLKTIDPDSQSVRQLLLRHLRPSPRVGWGLVLGEEHLATAMIDISDGLSSDIHHLCSESGVGASIESSRIPLDPLVTEICGRRALDPLLLALHGGEDFELLFTVSPEKVASLPKTVDGISISEIGRITNESGKICVTEKGRVWELESKGFDHFNRTS
jgi:thiamine-monophosphate kinase